MKKYIFLDLDGTITESAGAILSSAEHALKKLGIVDDDPEKKRAFIGPPLTVGFMELYGLSGEELTQAVKYYREFYVGGCYKDAPLYEGMEETLMKLREEDSQLKIPLGYIPAGSTNDFANSLGISRKMTDAAKDILSGEYYDCDIGQFNDSYYVYVAGFGAFTDVSYMTPQSIKNKIGHAAYIVEALKALPKITGQTLTVEHDGETFTDSFIVGLISNSRSIGGMKKLISKDVIFDDGLFEVVLAKTPENAIELSSLIANAATNKLKDKNFITFKTSRVTFTSENEIPWTLDGESGGTHKKVTIINHRKAVRFILENEDLCTEQQAANTDELHKSVRDAVTSQFESTASVVPDYVIEDDTDI